MAFRITGDLAERLTAVSVTGDCVEVRATAMDALDAARLLHEDGQSNVRITDTHTGEPCDEASLKRAAGFGGR